MAKTEMKIASMRRLLLRGKYHRSCWRPTLSGTDKSTLAYQRSLYPSKREGEQYLSRCLSLGLARPMKRLVGKFPKLFSF